MNSSPRRRPRPAPRPSQPLKRRSQRSSAGIILLVGLLYAMVGFIVTALPTFPWLWPLVLVSSWLHVFELTQPSSDTPSADTPSAKTLAQPLIQLAHWLSLALLTLTLAVALNYLGSDQLDDISLGGLFGQVLLLSLLAVLLAILCRMATVSLGERLLTRLQAQPTRLILATVSLVGLALGGAGGLLAM